MRADTGRADLVAATLVAGLAVLAAGAAPAQAPLSAIDWLSESVAAPPPAPEEPGTATAALPEVVTTTALDAAMPDGAGLLPPSVSGLPPSLWGPADPATVAGLIHALPAETLPAGRALMRRLLLAEVRPPAGDSAGDGVLIARIDKLLDLGLVEEAAALIDRAGRPSAELFRRAFDVSLLLGQEDAACTAMRARPDVAPTFPARIFCLARGGDWSAAALTLGTARVLGQVDDAEDALLSRFLDTDLFEGEPPLPQPERPSPLFYRMHEAVGEPLPSATLPRAFAHADLRPNAGWKSQIEAAERLARTGAVDPNRLFGLYTERRPAASGGVWDRVAAVQALDAALDAGDAGAVATALPPAFDILRGAGLAPALAAFASSRLEGLALDAPTSALAFRLALLTDGYEGAALARDPADAEEEVLVAIARGLPVPPAPGTVGSMLAGLAPDAAAPPRAQALLDDGRLGEAILAGLDDLAAGAAGNPRRMAAALALFRAAGLPSVARRAALEAIILADPA